jgi:hypothetical protein
VPHYTFLWRVSWVAAATAAYAAYVGRYDGLVSIGAVLTTSLLYWAHPTYCWRRWVDMTVVHTSLAYHSWLALSSSRPVLFFSVVTAGGGAYFVGLYAYRRGHLWASTYAHATLHLLANVSNLVLFSSV